MGPEMLLQETKKEDIFKLLPDRFLWAQLSLRVNKIIIYKVTKAIYNCDITVTSKMELEHLMGSSVGESSESSP